MRSLALVAALFAAALMLPSRSEAAAGETAAAPITVAGLQTALGSTGVPGARAGLPGYKVAQVRRRGLRRRRGFRRGRGVRRGRRGRRFRRGRWRRHHHDIGDAIAAGVAGAITLGIIAESTRVSRARGDWERCDDEYRSFRWSDGTFQPYGGGPRRLCPYLR